MIVDRIVAASSQLIPLVGPAHVVQVPLELFPINNNGGFGCEWTCQIEQDALVPRARDEPNLIDATWIRMPYERLVIFNAREDACVFLWTQPKLAGQRIPTSSKRTLDYLVRHHPELMRRAMVPTGEHVVVEAFGIFALVLPPGDMVSLGGADRRVLGRSCVCLMATVGFVAARADGTRTLATLGMQDVCAPMIADMNVLLGNELGGIVHRSERDFELDRMNMVLAVSAALALLNCKNITQRVVDPSRQARRLAERTGTPRPFRYHVLDLRTRRQNSGGSSSNGQPLALHWKRGHFKDYREGTGLFGHQHGLYWWSPHLAGQADRIVTKGYHIETMENRP